MGRRPECQYCHEEAVDSITCRVKLETPVRKGTEIYDRIEYRTIDFYVCEHHYRNPPKHLRSEEE